MCLDVSKKQSVIRRNTIRNTFARAITVHGTYGQDESNLGVSVSHVSYENKENIAIVTILQMMMILILITIKQIIITPN